MAILSSTLPRILDYESIFTQIEDQGETGSCVIFAETTWMETIYYMKTGRHLEFSIHEIADIYWDANQSNNKITIKSTTRSKHYTSPDAAISATNSQANFGCIPGQGITFCFKYNSSRDGHGNQGQSPSQICTTMTDFFSGKFIRIANSNSTSAFDEYTSILNNTFTLENIKKILINHGPVVISIKGNNGWHAINIYKYDESKFYCRNSYGKETPIIISYVNNTISKFSIPKYSYIASLIYYIG